MLILLRLLIVLMLPIIFNDNRLKIVENDCASETVFFLIMILLI